MIGASKLNEDKVQIIKDLLCMGEHTHQEIGDLFNVSREMVTAINNGRRWNPDNWSFDMREEKPKTGNDFREFGEPTLPIKRVELADSNEALDMEQKYYLVKFVESLTGKKIKKMIIEF